VLLPLPPPATTGSLDFVSSVDSLQARLPDLFAVVWRDAEGIDLEGYGLVRMMQAAISSSSQVGGEVVEGGMGKGVGVLAGMHSEHVSKHHVTHLATSVGGGWGALMGCFALWQVPLWQDLISCGKTWSATLYSKVAGAHPHCPALTQQMP